MRIKITKGGIFGQPTAENPTGELPIGHELTLDKAPVGWEGRYIDLDQHQPANGDSVGDLKSRIAELEAENAKLKKGDDDNAVTTLAEALALFSTDGVHANTAKAGAKKFLGDKVKADASKDDILKALLADASDTEVKTYLAAKGVEVKDETRDDLIKLALAA